MEMKQYENETPLTEQSEILQLLKSGDRRVAYISEPNELRIDIYEDGVRVDSEHFRIDPIMVVQLIWKGLIEPFERKLVQEPLTGVRYSLSEKGMVIAKRREVI